MILQKMAHNVEHVYVVLAFEILMFINLLMMIKDKKDWFMFFRQDYINMHVSGSTPILLEHFPDKITSQIANTVYIPLPCNG
jgi:hypothetical protein